ncbi:AI-2E family transporter, partial [Mycolicibacterium insubricum]|nr:AI-2E family transporter [Mycolicibacterium insubricum]
MFDEFSVIQKRWLTTLTIIALGFGAYFLRNYLELLAIGAVLAYLFNPAYQRLRARTNAGV